MKEPKELLRQIPLKNAAHLLEMSYRRTVGVKRLAELMRTGLRLHKQQRSCIYFLCSSAQCCCEASVQVPRENEPRTGDGKNVSENVKVEEK